MIDATHELIPQLRRDVQRARTLAMAALIFSALTLTGACLQARAEPSSPVNTGDVLRARGLVIVDEHGVERVVIGAPTPDPRDGKRVAPLHGIVINGPNGDERGGYGVMGKSDEGVLTLDAATGDEVFKVVANPDSGASVFVMHQNGAHAAMTTYRGAPELHLIGADGRSQYRQPEGTPTME